MKHTYYTICPYCGAHLDPGERCDCPRASPGGYQYGNKTGAKSTPVQIVHPNLPGLPEIMQDCPLDAMPCTGDCPDTTCPRHL